MSSCTVEDVYDGVRAAMSDQRVPGGQIFTNPALAQFLDEAYSEMFSRLTLNGSRALSKTVYYNLPENTNVLTPAQLGIVDFQTVSFIFERDVNAPIAVTAVAGYGTSGIQVTAQGHGLSTGSQGVLSGVGAGADGLWYFTVLGADNVVPNGATYSAEIGATGAGTLTTSTDKFKQLTHPTDVSGRDPADNLSEFAYRDGVILFNGATKIRQLKIQYTASGTTPVAGSIGIDNCRSFLVSRTAALAAAAKGRTNRAAELNEEAFGNIAKGKPGHLDPLVRAVVKQMQAERFRQPAFRPRTNDPYTFYY